MMKVSIGVALGLCLITVPQAWLGCRHLGMILSLYLEG